MGLAALAAVGLGGCGRSTVRTKPPAKKNPSPVATQAAEGIQELAASGREFVLEGERAGGDKVKVRGQLGAPITATQSGLNPEALNACGGPSGRAFAVALKLTATVESSLPVAIRLGELHGGALGRPASGSGIPAFVVETEGTPTCAGDGGPEVDFGTIPGEGSATTTVWVLLPEAITPEAPHPSEQQLEGWTMAVPQIKINESPVLGPEQGGTAMLDCEGATVITVAGTPMAHWTDSAGETYPCHPVPAP